MADINQFIDPKLIDSLTKINEQLVLAGQNIDQKLLPAIKQLEEAQKKLGKNTKENSEERKKLTANEKEAARIAKQLETTEAKLISLQKGQQDQLLKTKDALQKTTTAKKRELTSTNALTGSYIKINAELNKNITRYKSLSTEQRNNNKIGGKLLTTIQRQDKALKKLDTQMGRSQRNVGNYGAAFKSLIGAFGVTGGILGFVSVLKNAGNTIAQFDQAQATTAATLGKTKDEIEELTEASIAFGKSTQFNAVQVSILQNELAKLGFLDSEILASTGSILDLAEATSAGLGEAAKVVGSTLRGFNLAASESARVSSVLAVATTKSALSFQDYEAGLSNVVPVAAAFNFKIEDTIALYGKLRDSGFDASKATTALRNIILNLADSNGDLAKELGGNIKNFDEFIPAMIELRESGVDLNATLELTDKRSVAAFNTFLNSAESAVVLRDSLIDVNKELADMVETKTDNVIGASKRLGSAWDGVVLKFRESSGIFKRIFDDLATSLNAFTNDNISVIRKLIEVGSLGLYGRASKLQKEQDAFAKRLRTGTIEQVRFTIEKNGERLANGSKFEKNLLKMAQDRLAELEQAEIDSAERIKNEKLKKEQEEIFNKKKAEEEKTEIDKKESEKRIKQALKESDAKRDILEGEVDDFLKLNAESGKRLRKKARNDAKLAEETSNELHEIKLTETQAQASIDQKNADEAREIEKQNTEDAKQMAIQASIDVGNFLFDAKKNQLQREFEAAEGNAQKQAEISRKIAKQEKKQALFNVAINTAVAVSKVWGQTGIFGLAAQIPVLIMGALQAGLIAAQPIPQFAKGTNYAPGGVAELAEKGSELVKESSGKIWLAENRGLYNLKQGSTVLTAQQTQKELNDKNIVGELKLTRKAIQRMPRQKNSSRFDERQKGFREGYLASKHRLN